MATGAVPAHHLSKQHFPAMLHVTLYAWRGHIGFGRVDRFRRMRGAIVAALAGLSGTPPKACVWQTSQRLSKTPCARKRPVLHGRFGCPRLPAPAARRPAPQPPPGPREPLAENSSKRRPPQIVQIEPLRDAFGVANPPLVLERLFFFGHVSTSARAPRAPRSTPETRTKAARAPAASCAARGAVALHQQLAALFADLLQVAQHVVRGHRHDGAQVIEIRGHRFAAWPTASATRRPGVTVRNGRISCR